MARHSAMYRRCRSCELDRRLVLLGIFVTATVMVTLLFHYTRVDLVAIRHISFDEVSRSSDRFSVKLATVICCVAIDDG